MSEKPEGFAERLLAIWEEAQGVALDPRYFPDWSGATKDLLMVLGLTWDNDAMSYYLDDAVAKERRDFEKASDEVDPNEAKSWQRSRRSTNARASIRGRTTRRSLSERSCRRTRPGSA